MQKIEQPQQELVSILLLAETTIHRRLESRDQLSDELAIDRRSMHQLLVIGSHRRLKVVLLLLSSELLVALLALAAAELF